MSLIPFEDRVVIVQDVAKDKTEAGILIPENAQKKPSTGIIIDVGPGKPDKGAPLGYLLNDIFHQSLDGNAVHQSDRVVPVYAMPMKKGDRVMFAKFSGVEFVLEDGQEVLVMRMTDVIARV